MTVSPQDREEAVERLLLTAKYIEMRVSYCLSTILSPDDARRLASAIRIVLEGER